MCNGAHLNLLLEQVDLVLLLDQLLLLLGNLRPERKVCVSFLGAKTVK